MCSLAGTMAAYYANDVLGTKLSAWQETRIQSGQDDLGAGREVKITLLF